MQPPSADHHTVTSPRPSSRSPTTRSPRVSGHCPSALFVLIGQGCPLSLPALGRDWEVTIWMSGPLQRDREGQRGSWWLPAPCLSLLPRGLLCCFGAKVSQSRPILFCVFPPLPHLPARPRPTASPQRIEMPAQVMGPISVKSSVSLSLPAAGASQRPPVPALSSVRNFLSTIGLLPPAGFLSLLTKAASFNTTGRHRTPSLGSQPWGGLPALPPFTEASVFVLSALAAGNLCVGVCVCMCVWWGGTLTLTSSSSTQSPSNPPSAFLVLVELGFSATPVRQHCQKSVYVPVGGGAGVEAVALTVAAGCSNHEWAEIPRSCT